MPTKSIWVDNISSRITDEAFKSLFDEFGKIEKITVNRLHQSALIFFDKLESAKFAVEEMTGYRIGDKTLKVIIIS